ncbi:MAG: response regulator transcription factor [Chloroflexi bacterium]|nr:response regulator transcription factor [Chloroflexota bacterium]
MTRILVVDDHTLVRQGIIKILSSKDHSLEVEVVGEASNGFDAVTKARDLNADIVLMDLYMPGIDGVATTRLLKRELPNIEVIILTASDDEEDILEAIQAGARGYVLKSADHITLIRQLKQVISGGVGMSADLTTKLVTSLARRDTTIVSPNGTEHETLTEREKEVLVLIAKGATNKEIAQELFISENTVRAHVRTLMQKLQRDNRTQLAVFGVHEGYAVLGRNSTSNAGMARSG